MQTTKPTKPKQKNKPSKPSPEDISGKQRVIIKNVLPQVDQNRFPVKRTLGESVEVTADIFADGHDKIQPYVQYRKTDTEQWQEVPMNHILNDRWTGTFVPDSEGYYEYTIFGYVDHFASWQYALRKKFDAGQDLSVEMLIGAEMLEDMAKQQNDPEKHQLYEFANIFRDTSVENIEHAVAKALSDEVTALATKCYDRSNSAHYYQKINVEVERRKALFSTWYEFFPRSTSTEPGKHGDFQTSAKILPRIAEMGFDVVYLPPIHPIGKKFRKGLNNALSANPGDPGSCWAIGSDEGGHKAIHPELGTLKDFQDFVWRAGELGIEVALDIAFQCAPDHPYVKEHPQWFRWRPDGTVQYAENPPKKYQDILPINFENEDWQNLWEELKSVITYWIDKGVKIFRVDNPHTKSFKFWEWCIREIRQEHPEIIFLAEAFTRPRVMEWLAKIGFNQSYTYFTWRNNPWEMREYMLELTKGPMRDYFRPNFWPNTPDILTPELVHGGEAAHIMRLILAATLSSSYGLYGPVYEFGINAPYPGKEEYLDSEKYEVKHWDWRAETRIREIITIINRVRKENPALQSTWNVIFAEVQNDNILAYAKKDPESGNIMFMAVNMDPYNTQGAYLKVPMYELGMDFNKPYRLEDQISGATYHWQGEWNFVELNPYQLPGHVFKITQ
uniref:Alpha-1,4-glucan:maltose-1-phosphate maltosyltransferase n=1 Tax=Roseihalotalea indica TaxID=2867963 RepID=A0AA49JD03_9BACT|nr:alpha-1,4-glucan--maltose-1-phosphate maltosyltransferase [Tunicatimonas sp. TK19036]